MNNVYCQCNFNEISDRILETACGWCIKWKRWIWKLLVALGIYDARIYAFGTQVQEENICTLLIVEEYADENLWLGMGLIEMTLEEYILCKMHNAIGEWLVV